MTIDTITCLSVHRPELVTHPSLVSAETLETFCGHVFTWTGHFCLTVTCRPYLDTVCVSSLGGQLRQCFAAIGPLSGLNDVIEEEEEEEEEEKNVSPKC